jgi:hypothetical protein
MSIQKLFAGPATAAQIAYALTGAGFIAFMIQGTLTWRSKF